MKAINFVLGILGVIAYLWALLFGHDFTETPDTNEPPVEEVVEEPLPIETGGFLLPEKRESDRYFL